jgi:hypothetical protein
MNAFSNAMGYSSFGDLVTKQSGLVDLHVARHTGGMLFSVGMVT